MRVIARDHLVRDCSENLTILPLDHDATIEVIGEDMGEDEVYLVIRSERTKNWGEAPPDHRLHYILKADIIETEEWECSDCKKNREIDVSRSEKHE